MSELGSVTHKEQGLQCHLCSPSVTGIDLKVGMSACGPHPLRAAASFVAGSYHKYRCSPCAEALLAREPDWWTPIGPCAACGVPVYIAKSALYWWKLEEGRPPHCSSRCNKKVRLARRKMARAEQRGERSCKSCGRSFAPTRADAETCSNRCRQAAFRARKASDSNAGANDGGR
jgi:hypothetical protein